MASVSMKKKHAQDVVDLVDIEGYAQGNVPLTGTGADDDDLEEGLYDVWCDDNVYIKVDPTDASDVTTSTGYLVRAGNTMTVKVRSGSHLGGVLASGTGTLYYHKIG